MNCFVQSFCSLLVLPRGVRLCIYVGFGINLGFQLESNLWVAAGNLILLCSLCFLVFFLQSIHFAFKLPKKVICFYGFIQCCAGTRLVPWSLLVPVRENWPDWYQLSLIPNACLTRQGHEVMPALYQHVCAKLNTRPTPVLSCPIFCVNSTWQWWVACLILYHLETSLLSYLLHFQFHVPIFLHI
jgi:hypothetical protein